MALIPKVRLDVYRRVKINYFLGIFNKSKKKRFSNWKETKDLDLLVLVECGLKGPHVKIDLTQIDQPERKI